MFQNRDFLKLQDFSNEEIWQIMKTTHKFKNESSAKELVRVLNGKNVAMIFQKPSTRTRVSFEVAIRKLGGNPVYLDWSQLQLGRGETIADTARVLDRYVDAVVARVFSHKHLEEMSSHASIPVINALSNLYHPCQIVADLFTIWEKKGLLDGVKLAYVGDGDNVCNSLLIGCSKMGMNISVACPTEYKPHEIAVKLALENAQKRGSKIEITDNPKKAVEKADIIYTDTFISMGLESEREKRIRAFLPKFQVNTDLFRYTSENAVFMHCLPAHRGEEVTDKVIDGARSIVWDQAENRLHTAEAILDFVIEVS